MKQSTFNKVVVLTALGLTIACIWLMVRVGDFYDYLENYYG